MRLNPFSRLSRRKATIEALYGAIVAQARTPVFYLEYGVSDTVNGRFEMILLHGGLLLDRMDGAESSLRRLGQGVFDRFCLDMDDTLRERGVSDLKVPREMKRVGEAFYGRQAAYRTTLAESDPAALISALRRNLYATGSDPVPDHGVARMAAYMRNVAGFLRQEDTLAGLEAGRLVWPDPAGIDCPSRTCLPKA